MRGRELAYCGIFGAAALLLPTIFHALHLGHIFMPMYLPLVALGFMVSPGAAALTAFTVPLLSGYVTGMPPFNPPVALVMALELSVISALIAAVPQRWRTGRWAVLLLLSVALLLGRILYALLFYTIASAMGLKPAPLVLLSFVSGWPGVLLMLVVIPQLVAVQQQIRRSSPME